MESHGQDLYAWTQRNAQLIREGRFEEIDAENVADELESMGRAERREILNRLIVLIAHLLKWQYQSPRRSPSWIGTIKHQRRQIEIVLEDNPSLRRELPETLLRAYEYARKDAADETGFADSTFPVECPYTIEQIMDEDFFPELKES